MKRLTVTLLLSLFIMMVPIQAFASDHSGQYYPPSGSEYYMKKFAWQFYADFQTHRIKFTQYSVTEPDKDFHWHEVPVTPNSFIWIDFYCQGVVAIEFLDSNGNRVGSMSRGPGTSYLDGSSQAAGKSCTQLSDYDANTGGFGGKPDGMGGNGGSGGGGNGEPGGDGGTGGDGGSGGDGGTGSTGKVTIGWNPVSNPSKGKPSSYEIIRDGVVIGTVPGSSNSYTDSTAKVGETHDYEVVPVYGDGSKGDHIDIGEVDVDSSEEIIVPGGPIAGKCDNCKIFSCPGWGEYMGKLDDIKNAIPPAPDWPKVADTFRDSIVPKLVDDIGDLLGTAPTPPATPPELPGIDDREIKNKEPEMQDVPGLKDAGFDADKIKNQAPTIPEREDPTGGFDLSTNPMDSLPDAPENPKPGETDAGEWGKNKPKEPDNPFPYPEDQGEPNIGSPPKPGDNGATPPSPDGDPGSAPTPGGDLGNGPSPGGSGGDPNMLDYKPSPGSADGSGGVIGP